MKTSCILNKVFTNNLVDVQPIPQFQLKLLSLSQTDVAEATKIWLKISLVTGEWNFDNTIW